MAKKDEKRLSAQQFLRQIEATIERASEAGSPDSQLQAMFNRLLDSTGAVLEEKDEWAALFGSGFHALVALRLAKEAVDYLAAERVNGDLPMADTRLKMTVELAKIILMHVDAKKPA